MTFDVPGSAVQLAGTYDLLGQALSFKGQLLMDAKISETTTGGARVMLRAVDPLFGREGGGSTIPITIGRTREAPTFGLDTGRVFSRGT